MITPTEKLYAQASEICARIFEKKAKDYGTSWQILRLPSLTDQIFIKAQRIRSIEEKGVQVVDESIEEAFIGIVNYCAIALVQMNKTENDLNTVQAIELYHNQVDHCKHLMLAKNHDYGEAWRDMRVSTYTDLILMKLLRIKQIEDAGGQTLISEGVEAGYMDILNYAIFALIQLNHFFDTKIKQ